MRNAAIATIIASFFVAGAIYQDKQKETQAAPQTFAGDSAHDAALERIVKQLESLEERMSELQGAQQASQPEPTEQGTFVPIEPTTEFVNLQSDVCTAGNCGTVSAYSGRRWTPIRNVSSRWQSRRSSGNRFPILRRVFGRR